MDASRPGSGPSRRVATALEVCCGEQRLPIVPGRLSVVHNLSMDRLRIGRAPDNDIVLDDLLVSRYHAELLRHGPDWWLVDPDSPNGSYVNGQRVTGAPIGSQDVVGIGHALLQVNGDRLVEHIDVGEVSFRGQGLVVRTSAGRQLLDRVGFSLEQRSLLAVVGPSGAGNTTLRSAGQSCSLRL